MSRHRYFFKGLTARNRDRTDRLFHRIRRFDNVADASVVAGISRNQAYKHISHLGFTPVYLTAAEEMIIRKHREMYPTTLDEHTRTLE